MKTPDIEHYDMALVLSLFAVVLAVCVLYTLANSKDE